MTIELPQELAQRLQQRVDASNEFTSVAEYAAYILDEVLKQTDDTTNANNDATYSKDQEADVKQRLSDLGYLD